MGSLDVRPQIKSVLLVNPGWDGIVSKAGKRFNRAWPPLSLMVCASLLEQNGFFVHIIDGRVDTSWRERLVQLGTQFDKVVLTSSPLDRWQCPNLELDYFFQCARLVPPSKLWIMGAHGTLFPELILRQTGAEVVIIGEPEQTLLALCSGRDWAELPGIAFLQRERMVHTGEPVDLDLGTLPVPAFHLIDISRYRYELLGDRFALFEGSRGCPFSCSFCLKVMFGSKVRFKPVEHLLAEVDEAVVRFGVRSGYFIDLEFSLNRDRTMEICKCLAERRYPFIWCCQTRADSVDRELLYWMKQAGCRLIHFGVESGSEEILDQTKKGIDLASIRRGIALTTEAGIETACFFMFGFPGETRVDMERTIEFSRSLNPTYASFHIVTPYPGTLLHLHLTKQNPGMSRRINFITHYPSHSQEFLNEMTRKAFRNFYLRPGYIWSRIKAANVKSWINQLRLFNGFVH
nr:radical SAM protein [Desulfobacterales bacterium]